MTIQTRTAADALIAKCLKIDDLIARITEAREDHFGADPETTDWGYAGSADYVIERLSDICEFLNA